MPQITQKFQDIDELLPSFIEHLKRLPAIYASDAPNVWENWIELPEMHCESSLLDVYSILHEWASTHLAQHLELGALRENWLETSDDGSDAFDQWVEENEAEYEAGADFPEAHYPHVNVMATLLADDLIHAAHSRAFQINQQREDDEESNS